MKWVDVDTNVKGYGQDIIYANEMFWLAHYDPCGIAYSNDLKNWTDIKLDSSKISQTKSLAFGNSKFMITGNANDGSNTYIAISDDGINWNYNNINTGKDFSMTSNSCRFINNRFVFITGWYNYNIVTGIRNYTIIQIYETIDGNNITKHEFRYDGPDNIDSMDIAYGNGLYVIVGCTGTIIISKDLKNWTKVNSGVTDKLVGVIYGRNMFVVTGANGTILTSVDGINWTKQKSNTTSYLIRSRYGNGTFIAVGYNGTILTSINGIDWVEEQDNFVRTVMYGVVFANNYYVVSAGRYSSTGTIPITYSQISRELTYSNDESFNFNFSNAVFKFS